VETVRKAIVESGNDRLQVGFNRRFAPLVVAMAESFAGRTYPLFMNYRVHAGQMESTSWYLDGKEGSRFVGEGGHFLDVFAYLTGSRPVTVSAVSQRPASATADDRDNLCVTITYADGSIGNLLYLTQGGSQVPKEQLEVFGGGTTAHLDNFARLDLYRGDRGASSVSGRLDKGQQKEMAAFVEAVVSGGPLPIGIDCLFETTLATLAADESLSAGRPIAIAEFWTSGEDARPDGEAAAGEVAVERRG
jgi:predicted dehydrogenase